jgi:hypothetical protein
MVSERLPLKMARNENHNEKEENVTVSGRLPHMPGMERMQKDVMGWVVNTADQIAVS